MKYYAVRKGYKTGIFVDWEECKSYVCGFSGAEYKIDVSFIKVQAHTGVELNERADKLAKI